MRFEEITRKQRAETDGEEPEVPEDFSCIDPQQKPLVFDFLNTFDQVIEGVVLAHLQRMSALS